MSYPTSKKNAFPPVNLCISLASLSKNNIKTGFPLAPIWGNLTLFLPFKYLNVICLVLSSSILTIFKTTFPLKLSSLVDSLKTYNKF